MRTGSRWLRFYRLAEDTSWVSGLRPLWRLQGHVSNRPGRHGFVAVTEGGPHFLTQANCRAGPFRMLVYGGLLMVATVHLLFFHRYRGRYGLTVRNAHYRWQHGCAHQQCTEEGREDQQQGTGEWMRITFHGANLRISTEMVSKCYHNSGKKTTVTMEYGHAVKSGGLVVSCCCGRCASVCSRAMDHPSAFSFKV